MEPITGLDATFLYAETANSPMHVGSVTVIEGSLKFDDFRKVIESRLHLIPKLRQRLMQVPFNIDYPYWVDDPNFDLDMHLQRIALPKPGSWKELRSIASSIMSEPLDRTRPLWHFTFVEGLDNIPQVPKGSVAIISKIHHVAIDGMAGTSIMGLLFDLSPNPTKLKEPKPYEPKPLPDPVSLMLNSSMSFVTKPFKFPRIMADTLTATFKLGFMNQAQHIKLPTAPFTAPPSPLNRIISPRRKWNSALLSFDRIKALKDLMDTTFNDVILAICAGALRRYLLEKKKLPLKPLVGMVPVSTRTDGESGGTSGNQISSMLVQLATNIENPIERLETIAENTIRTKTYQNALGAKTLAKMAEAVPFGIANQAAQLYTRFKVAEMHNPVFNVTITNVPGPQMPLYLNGHKALAVMGMAPIIDGMGLIITVFSYNGLVSISPTSDANTMPDIDIFTRYIRECANELEAAILVHTAEQAKPDNQEDLSAESEVFFESIREFLKENPDLLPKNAGVFQVHIEGDTPTDWKIDLSKSPATVRKSGASNPDVLVKVQEKYLMRIIRGELDLPTAFMQGRVKVEGDMSKLPNLAAIFTKISQKS
jgi:WS/DGAT/MGAT family acyltransferase